MGAMALGQAAPNFTTMMTGAGAAYTIFQTIDRKPEIDSLSDEGKKVRGAALAPPAAAPPRLPPGG